MEQKIYQIVCHFKAVGIKEVPAETFEAAVKLAQTEKFEFKQIGRIEECVVDDEHSRIIAEQGMSEDQKKEYLNWGSE